MGPFSRVLVRRSRSGQGQPQTPAPALDEIVVFTRRAETTTLREAHRATKKDARKPHFYRVSTSLQLFVEARCCVRQTSSVRGGLGGLFGQQSDLQSTDACVGRAPDPPLLRPRDGQPAKFLEFRFPHIRLPLRPLGVTARARRAVFIGAEGSKAVSSGGSAGSLYRKTSWRCRQPLTTEYQPKAKLRPAPWQCACNDCSHASCSYRSAL